MAIDVTLLKSEDFSRWDKFVRSNEEGTFCHLSGWKTVIEKGAGQACPYLIAKNGGVIVGVLPLTIKRHFLFGKALISNMFCVYGGALGNDESVIDALYEHAWKMAEESGLPELEIRGDVANHTKSIDWVSTSDSATFGITLAETAEEQLLAIPRKQRAVIRKSLKNGLTTDWNGSLDIFYDLYAQSVLSLGTPVFPKSLFEELKSTFGDSVQIQITKTKEGQPVASLMSFYFEGTVMPYYAGGTPAVRRLAAHDFMYYNLMLNAKERGCTQFDFGRSKVDSGPYKFKKNWGFTPTVLPYYTRLMLGSEKPNLSQQSGPYATLSKVWKKLPLKVSKVIGPPLARHLG